MLIFVPSEYGKVKEVAALISYRKTHLSVFAKVLIIFVAAIFPLYLFNIQLNITGRNDVRMEIAESTKARVSFYLSSLEKEVENIIIQESNLVNNEYLKKIEKGFEQLDLPQQFNTMNMLRDRLKEISQMSGYIQEITVYFPQILEKISDTTISDMNMQEYYKIKALFINGIHPFAMQGNDIYINITPDIYSSEKDLNSSNPCIISVKLSNEKLSGDLAIFSGNSRGGAFIISSSNGINVNNALDKTEFIDIKKYLETNTVSEENAVIDVININREKYILCYKKSSLLHSTFVTYLPEEQLLGSLSGYTRNLWIMSGLMIIIVGLFTLWIKGMISKPLQKLIDAFRKVEKGDLDIVVKYSHQDEFGYIYSQFNDMFARLRTLIEQVYEQKIHVKNAELKQLQYQINPHFLYNSILIGYSLIRMKDYDCALKLLQHLSSYYQYITRSKQDEVPLWFEINHAKDYVEIQNIRFENRISAVFEDLPGECRDILVPRLVIQPIIENSYKYGLHDKMADGKLSVKFSKSSGAFDILIEDNGTINDADFEKIKNISASSDQLFESTGLFNVHRRLQIKYGNKSGLLFSKTENGGLCVNLHIVIEEGQDV